MVKARAAEAIFFEIGFPKIALPALLAEEMTFSKIFFM